MHHKRFKSQDHSAGKKECKKRAARALSVKSNEKGIKVTVVGVLPDNFNNEDSDSYLVLKSDNDFHASLVKHHNPISSVSQEQIQLLECKISELMQGKNSKNQ